MVGPRAVRRRPNRSGRAGDFAGPHKAQHYAELLIAGYKAVNRVDPNIKVLGGSLVGANGLRARVFRFWTD